MLLARSHSIPSPSSPRLSFPLPQAFCPSRTNLVQNPRQAAAIPSFKVHEWSRKTLEEDAMGYGREEAVSAPLSDLPSLR